MISEPFLEDVAYRRRIMDYADNVHADCCAWLQDAGYTLRALDESPVESSGEMIATVS